MSATCRGCKAPIIWAQTTNGRAAPIDEVPVPNGNIELEPNPDPREPPTAHSLDVRGEREISPGVKQSPLLRYVSHFATCPKAALFRFGQVPR